MTRILFAARSRLTFFSVYFLIAPPLGRNILRAGRSELDGAWSSNSSTNSCVLLLVAVKRICRVVFGHTGLHFVCGQGVTGHLLIFYETNSNKSYYNHVLLFFVYTLAFGRTGYLALGIRSRLAHAIFDVVASRSRGLPTSVSKSFGYQLHLEGFAKCPMDAPCNEANFYYRCGALSTMLTW